MTQEHNHNEILDLLDSHLINRKTALEIFSRIYFFIEAKDIEPILKDMKVIDETDSEELKDIKDQEIQKWFYKLIEETV